MSPILRYLPLVLVLFLAQPTFAASCNRCDLASGCVAQTQGHAGNIRCITELICPFGGFNRIVNCSLSGGSCSGTEPGECNRTECPAHKGTPDQIPNGEASPAFAEEAPPPATEPTDNTPVKD